MVRLLGLGMAALGIASFVQITDAAAQSRTSTAGQSYQSRTYQENSSANRTSAAASRAFSTNSNSKK